MDKNSLKKELFELVLSGKISTLYYGELLNILSSNKLKNLKVLNVVNNVKILYN
jgi:hypothetical protein